jgi:hypothetical protein
MFYNKWLAAFGDGALTQIPPLFPSMFAAGVFLHCVCLSLAWKAMVSGRDRKSPRIQKYSCVHEEQIGADVDSLLLLCAAFNNKSYTFREVFPHHQPFSVLHMCNPECLLFYILA